MVMAIRGGHNGWDEGRAVPPFAPHNVLIAAVAGLWMIPPGLYLLTSPIRTWRRLRRTGYVLTNRRAIVIEPRFLGRAKTRSYSAAALRLMRVEECRNGSGDLVFECPSRWAGLPQTVGFLAIDQGADVEALVRNTLLSKTSLRTDSPAEPGARTTRSTRVEKRFRISLGFRVFQFVLLAAAALVTCAILADFVVILGIIVLRPQLALDIFLPQVKRLDALGGVGAIAAGAGASIAALFVAGMFCYFALLVPVEITINEDRDISFRSRLRTVTIPIQDISMIRTGQWFDPNRFQAIVEHKRGKLMLVNLFSDFRDLLATVRDLNPAIEIKGF
jgi:hypothetical protein